MAIGGAAKCAKIILIIINCIFLLSGLLLIAIGIWLIVDQSVLKIVNFAVAEQSALFRASAALLIAMGVFAVLVSALGFAAAITEKAVLLGIYIALLVVVFCGEIAAGVIAIVYEDKIIKEATTSMTKSLKTVMNSTNDAYYSVNNSTGKCQASDKGALWDYVQVYFECCGVGSYAMSGYEDAGVNLPSICPSLNLRTNKPLTCCSHVADDLKPIDTTDEAASANKFDCHQIIGYGCADAIVAWISKYAPVLIGIGIGIAMLEMIVVIFALCLCQHRQKDDAF